MNQQFILVTLLFKLGVVTAIASALVRSRRFHALLFRDERTLRQKIGLVLSIGLPFALCTVGRLAGPKGFLAGDLTLESTMLLGVIGGRFAGAAGGVLVTLPALIAGSWIWLPFNLIAGLLAGQARELAPSREAAWSFSPFVDLSIYRWVRKHLRRPRVEWQLAFFLLIVVLRLAKIELARFFPDALVPLSSSSWWVEIAAYLTSGVAVAIPLKIWNSARIELKLEQQERLLLQARMEALQSQINPHFLFNTLNSVASLVRVQPDTARLVIVKLGNILRRLLRNTEAFATMREEVDFIDDYLDIEVVRFGPDKLRVTKELDADTLDATVPSMMLQPLVENSIKHGLTPKVEGGTITLRSRYEAGALVIEVEDDGVGIGRPAAAGEGAPSSGIGLMNIAGRLKVLYGDGARMTVSSGPAGGTLVRVILPALQQEQVAGSIAEALAERRGERPAETIAADYELRSSTTR
jgi:two-component system LytT family sensor kinase